MLSSREILGTATGPLWSLSREAVIAVEEIEAASIHQPETSTHLADEIAILQYTSGSTGTPRGVALTHQNLLANLEAAYLIWDVPDAVAVFWLPPYHDMGLIGGILLPVYGGRRVVLMSPKSFLQRPVRLLQAIHRYQGTSSGSPNFGYELCVRKITDEDCRGLDLSTWRIAVVGAEPVRASTMERFAERFAPYRFNASAVTPAYGMAESTVVISGKRKGTLPLYQDFDTQALQRHWAIPATRFSEGATTRLVSCGPVVPTSSAIIVDPQSLRRCAPGEIGEIWVRGPSVAAGYWNQPEVSQEVFQAQLANAGSKEEPSVDYLRTGDLGFESSGQLFVNGRLKELIILAGRNYYPHDIEKAFQSASTALRPDCGVAFSIDVEDEERLVIVQEVLRPQKLDLAQIIRDGRVALSEAYNLSPHAIVLVASGSLPKTSSGKLRRNACRELYLQNELRSLQTWNANELPVAESQATLELPYAGTESTVAELWQEVLNVAQVYRQDDFFHLGGHSLSAVQLIQSVQEKLGITIPLSYLFDHSIFERFVASLPGSSLKLPHVLSPSTNAATTGPLTRAQQRFWMLHALHQQGTFNQVPLTVHLNGTLDLNALQKAFTDLIQTHATLRTRFMLSGSQPVQEVVKEVPFELGFCDLSAFPEADRQLAYERLRQHTIHQPFDFESPPLFRAQVFQHTASQHELLLVWHHIVCDGWSAQTLLNELADRYQQRLKGDEIKNLRSDSQTISLIDYALWERSAAGESIAADGLIYWNKRLSGVSTELELPVDSPRGLLPSAPSQSICCKLPADFCANLDLRMKEWGVTEFMVHLAAWQYTLARYTQSQDVLVGVPTANRSAPSLQSLTGCFINTIPLRGRIDPQATVSDWLQQVRRDVIKDLEHGHTPFERIVESMGVARSLHRMPLVQNLFLYQPELDITSNWGTAEVAQIAADYSALEAFDLTLVVEHHGGTEVRLVYPPALFEAATVTRLLDNYVRVLNELLAHPNKKLEALELLGRPEIDQLIAWNGTERSLPAFNDVAQWVSSQAKASPDTVATVDDSGSLTYNELNQFAERVAHTLQCKGIAAGSRIGICLPRTRHLPAWILGIWKAGCAYVPLDPNYPSTRLSGMLTDAAIEWIVTESHAKPTWVNAAVALLTMDDVGASHAQPCACASQWNSDGDRLAYVMYTSGSTGLPKGVMISQRSVLNMLQSFAHQPGFTPRDSLLALTTVSFDISVLELFLPLVCGGRVVIAPDQVALQPELLHHWLDDPSITWVQGTPSTFRLLFTSGWYPGSHLTLLCGGEPVTPELGKQLTLNGAELWNVYGPTETTVWSTLHRVTDTSRTIPIGHPLDNTQVWIVDAQGDLAPLGVAGELVIGGAGVAKGYWNRPELTATKFVPRSALPFSHRLNVAPNNDIDQQVYFTGDQARWRPDGTLQFLARTDRQVKVRGHRIELGDVEAHLERHPAIRAVAVVKIEQNVGAGLVAYCVATNSGIDASQVREFAHQQLPEYMVPTHIAFVDELPRTPAGKVDYKALPAIALTISSSVSVPPRTPLERELARLWCEVLERAQVGVHDNFFDLGGHSLRAAQLFARMRDTTGYDLPLRELYQRATIAEQAEWIVHQQLQSVTMDNAEALLQELEQMSDADALKLLQSRDASVRE